MKCKAFLLMLLALAGPATAVLAQTFDTPATPDEGHTYIHYFGTVDMSPDSLDSYHTQALLVGNANQGAAILQGIAADSTGTEDINIFAEFSQDLKSWHQLTPAVVDSQSITVTYTSLHTAAGDTLDGSLWLRLHFDGQTGNSPTTVRWDVFLPKNTGAPELGAAVIRDRRQ